MAIGRRSKTGAWGVVCLALLVTGRPVAAQAPAAEPPRGPPAPKPESPIPGAPQPDLEFTATTAFGNLNQSGSRPEFFRYHRPPRGLYFGLIRLLRRDPVGFPLQEVWWRNAGEADEKGYVDLHARNTPSYLRFWRDTSGFFGDPGVAFAPFSDREENRLRLHLGQVGSGPTLDFQFREHQVSIPAVERFLPARAIDYRAQEYGFRTSAPVGAGRLYLEPRLLRFDNRVGRDKDSNTSSISAELVHPLGNRAGLGASYEGISTEVGTRDRATWSTVRLRGVARPAEWLLVEALYRGQTVTLPSTLTDFADRTDLGLIQATAYPVRHGTVTAGFFRQSIRRAGRGVGDSDSSTWNGGIFRVRHSNPGLWSLNARLRAQELSDAPVFLRVGTGRLESLYYTQDVAGSARLDVFPTSHLSLYADFAHRTRRNSERDTRVTLNAFTTGAVAQLTDRLSFSAEYSRQFWEGNTRPLRSAPGTVVGALPLRFYFSDGSLITSALTYQLDRRSSLDLSFNRFVSSGGQRSRDTLGLLHFRRSVSPGFHYGIGFQIEDFNDSTSGRAYHSLPLLLEVGFHRRFR